MTRNEPTLQEFLEMEVLRNKPIIVLPVSSNAYNRVHRKMQELVVQMPKNATLECLLPPTENENDPVEQIARYNVRALATIWEIRKELPYRFWQTELFWLRLAFGLMLVLLLLTILLYENRIEQLEQLIPKL